MIHRLVLLLHVSDIKPEFFIANSSHRSLRFANNNTFELCRLGDRRVRILGGLDRDSLWCW
jgi:hypothetical protein